MISLYIHIPFCVKKCEYCDFISFKYDSEKLNLYLDKLIEEIKVYKEQSLKVRTIFLGGGTPSLLNSDQVKKLFEVLKNNFDLSACDEITIETNPGTINEEKISCYKSVGINRISMGVQTLKNETLKTLGRIHDVNTVFESVDLLKNQGFHNFNLDLMFGLPGQTIKQLSETVDEMIRLNPTHISAYSLKIEEGTPFYDQYENGTLKPVDEDLDREMYHTIVSKLKNAGYHQYEISNFSKKGFECQHNLVYWQEKEYLGLGLGAHSFMAQKRFSNETDMDKYLSSNQLIRKEAEVIEKDEAMFEMIMLRLRLNEGLPIQLFNNRFCVDFLKVYHKEIEELIEMKLVLIEDNYLRLTDLGRDLSNSVYIKFL